MSVAEILIETRDNLARERACRGFFPSFHGFGPPSWMREPKPGHKLHPFFRDQQLLLGYGKVVWAHIVQANMLAFEPRRDDTMAAVVFSEEEHFDANLEELGQIAHKIFELKENPSEDPELEEIGDVVRSETTIAINYALPLSLSSGRQVYFTDAFVVRKFLPNGFITFPWFPFLILPERTKASMILPCSYWPFQFRLAWANTSSDENEE